MPRCDLIGCGLQKQTRQRARDTFPSLCADGPLLRGRRSSALRRVQLFPQIEEAMVQPLRESRDRYEELKQIDDAMNEVGVPGGGRGRGIHPHSEQRLTPHLSSRCRRRKVRT